MPKRKPVKQLEPENSNLTEVSATANGSTARKKRIVNQERIETDHTRTASPASQGTSSRLRKRFNIKEEVEEETELDVNLPKTKRKTKTKQEPTSGVEEQDNDRDGGVAQKQVKKKRQTKAEKETEMLSNPLAARSLGHKLFIGAHVSSAGGVHNAPLNSLHIGANAFALFLKSQRKWVNPGLSEDHCTHFHAHCKDHEYDPGNHVVPHGSYLVNLAHTDATRTKQAYDSYLDDLKRCEKLGIKLYNIHPGNNQGNDRDAAIAHLARNINKAHQATNTVITLLENMAAGGNVLGSTFEDLRDIITLVENKERVGVCIDTCHAFAGGYDLRTPAAFKATMDQFDETVGFKYLRAMHINDSKAPFASHRDLHANIGTGFLGLRAFHNLVNDSRFTGLPLILETPIEVRDENGNLVKDEKGKEKEDKGIWAREIKMLESLVGMDPDSEEFLELETKLARQGEPERNRLAEQQERKQDKKEKQAAKGAKKQSKLQFGKKAKTAKDGSDEDSAVSDDKD